MYHQLELSPGKTSNRKQHRGAGSLIGMMVRCLPLSFLFCLLTDSVYLHIAQQIFTVMLPSLREGEKKTDINKIFGRHAE